MSEYRFERLTEKHYPDLIKISKSAFNIDPGISYYRNKNNTSKFGEPHLGFIAYSEQNEPAAFYGVYACPVILNGKTFVAAQSGDTMTHKDHGGKGLFTTLAKMTYDLAKEKGIDFIFGFPNYNSYPGFVKKLNWICPANLIEFRDKKITFPLAKISKRFKLFSGIYSAYARLILSLYKSDKEYFNSSTIEQDIGSVNRNPDYFKYKSFSGNKLIRIGDTNLWIKIDGFLYIGDIERKSDFDYKSFWKKIKKLGFLLGSDTIVFQVEKDTFFDQIISKFIEPKDAYPVGFLNLSNKTDPSKYKYVFGDVDTF